MAAPAVTEYTIRCPKNSNKKLQVMRFASERDIDFKKWTNVKMERENNMREFKGIEEDQPKFGLGSEFGRDQREEARRKKLGIVSRKYKSENQPWMLKVGGKTGRKYKGIRDGGISDNAAYYIFTHAPGGNIEAYPLSEWYNFTAIQRFKTLTSEEAEEIYSKRNKSIDFFSLMTRNRLRGEVPNDDEETKEEKKKGKKKKKDFNISEMDEWISSEDEDDDDEESGEEKAEKKEAGKKKKKQDLKNKKKKKKGSDDEAIEESDDGDEEGREHEYISDSSSSESEHEGTKQLKGVAEEDALRKLLTSDEDSDEEKKDEDKKDEDKKDEDGDKAEEDKPAKSNKKSKKKAAVKTEVKAEHSSSELSLDSSDDDKKKVVVKEEFPMPQPSAEKRKATNTPPSSPPAKKHRPEGASDSMEDAVRRYLARKPMTTTELLQKFKSKKTGMSSEQLLKLMTQILKRINPVRQTIKGKMYLSIKK